MRASEVPNNVYECFRRPGRTEIDSGGKHHFHPGNNDWFWVWLLFLDNICSYDMTCSAPLIQDRASGHLS